MDRQAQLEAMMRQYMASQQNRGAVSDAEMQMMQPGMGQMTDADMAIQQNQQFNQDAQQQQNAQQYQADQFRGSQQISPEQYMGLLQMLGGGR